MGPNEVVALLLGVCLAATGIVSGSIVLRLLRRARAYEQCFTTLALHMTERRVAEVEPGQHAVDVGALSEAMRALAGSSNPSAARTAVCEGARTVAAAPIAALLEPTPDGSCLTVASSLGADLRGLIVPFAGERSRAAEAFAAVEAVFVPDA